MQVYDWNEVPREQMSATVTRQVIHTEKMTIARLQMKKGCLVPEHKHHNEQVSMMQEGSLKFIIDGKELILKAGEALRIPPNVPHSAEALEDSVATDLFSPPRDDWQRGDDAYLRG